MPTSNKRRKICFLCYREAIIYQPLEVSLRYICIYPEQFTNNPEKCEVHQGWSNSDILKELYSWDEK